MSLSSSLTWFDLTQVFSDTRQNHQVFSRIKKRAAKKANWNLVYIKTPKSQKLFLSAITNVRSLRAILQFRTVNTTLRRKKIHRRNFIDNNANRQFQNCDSTMLNLFPFLSFYGFCNEIACGTADVLRQVLLYARVTRRATRMFDTNTSKGKELKKSIVLDDVKLIEV